MSHAPLTTFPPKWLRTKADGKLTPVSTKIGWANPKTGEQVVAVKSGLLPNAVPYYKPNAMGNSFDNPAGNAPGQVALPTTNTVTGTGFHAAWTAPTVDGPAITSYNVVVKQGTTVIPSGQVAVTGTTAVVSGLTVSTAYTVTVAAVNSVGTGTVSAAASVTTSAT
jgi:hypothetical protein